jgi:hypothetical protein
MDVCEGGSHFWANFDEGRRCQCGEKTVRATRSGYFLIENVMVTVQG